MPTEHWRRDAFTFYNFNTLGPRALDGPAPVEGLPGALMSRDPRTGAETLVADLPAGWRREVDGKGATLELFVLKGDASLEGDGVGNLGYVCVPQGGGGGELRSEHGAQVLVFWNPDMPTFPPPHTANAVKRFWDIPWTPSLRDGSHGIMHKSLRTPDPAGDSFDGSAGGFLRIAFHAPGVDYPQEHVHEDCWEEIIYLSGDMMLSDEGIMGVGSVVSHPQEWWHGPFASRGGCILLNQSDGPMGYPWPARDVPFQKELCETYFDIGTWGEPAEHTPWEAVDDRLLAFQRTDEYRRSAATEAAAEWGDRIGREAASKFRAGWHFSAED